MVKSQLRALIGSGESADVYRLADGRVLKLFRDDVQPGIAQREIDGATRAWEEGLHVARPLALETVDGREAIIFEGLDGRPAVARSWVNLPGMRQGLRALAEYQAQMHRRSAAGLIHLQHHILDSRIATSTAPDRLKEAALALNAALPRGSQLCHGDYHPGNAISTDKGIAVIDWSNAHAGTPAADVARTELLIRYGRYGPRLQRYRPLRMVRHLAASFYVRCYCRTSGTDPAEIALWRMPIGVAWLQEKTTADERSLMAIF
jgi:thiamine kinase